MAPCIGDNTLNTEYAGTPLELHTPKRNSCEDWAISRE